MKKVIALLIFVLLLCSAAIAQKGRDGGMADQGNGSDGGAGDGQGEGTGNGSDNGNQVEANVENQQQNQGEDIQIKNQEEVKTELKAGNYDMENGQQLQVQGQEQKQLKVGETVANTNMELVREQVQQKTMLTAKLSNGKNAEIKVMPDAASEKAIEMLKLHVCSEENGCTIELKEVGQGEEVKAAYEVKAQKEVKVLGFIKAQMKVQAQVDAENGEAIQTKKAWWAFMAKE